MHNLLVEQNDKQTILYDTHPYLFSTWTNDLLYTISGHKYLLSSHYYYDDKCEFNKKYGKIKPRCIIVNHVNSISIDQQVECFIKMGIKNILVSENSICTICKDDMIQYNTNKYHKFFF